MNLLLKRRNIYIRVSGTACGTISFASFVSHMSRHSGYLSYLAYSYLSSFSYSGTLTLTSCVSRLSSKPPGRAMDSLAWLAADCLPCVTA